MPLFAFLAFQISMNEILTERQTRFKSRLALVSISLNSRTITKKRHVRTKPIATGFKSQPAQLLSRDCRV